ncbi:hypothetical protein NC651_004789 [Populus alba x Populus x berolinensis]|nr:hypothetical protein NC651_004789 [Populus alba x Populus x berolinensis]
MDPLIWLLERSSVVKFVKLPNQKGIKPERSKNIKLDKRPNVRGIGPLKPLTDKLKVEVSELWKDRNLRRDASTEVTVGQVETDKIRWGNLSDASSPITEYASPVATIDNRSCNASTRRKHGLQDASEGDVGGSTQGGDGKELGRFMELGSSYDIKPKHCQSRLNYFKESLPIACSLEATGSSSTLFMKQRPHKTWNESMKMPCT